MCATALTAAEGIANRIRRPPPNFRQAGKPDLRYSRHRMALEKIPNQIVGVDVRRRFAEEFHPRLPAGPGVSAAVDGIQNHFRAVFSAAPHRLGHRRAIMGGVGNLFDLGLARAAVDLGPYLHRVVRPIRT